LKLAYYPGCSLDASAIEYNLSTQKTASVLGVELEEIPGWGCCGATSAHSTNKLLSVALPARNLAIAEKEGLDVLAPCAACYSRSRATEHLVREDAELAERVREAIGMPYTASNRTLSILEVLVQTVGLEAIAAKVTNPLKGMKPACYYGCLLVRPVEYTGFDDPEYPQSMDKIMKVLGANPVKWSYQTECCGASLVTMRPDVGLKMTYAILKNAVEQGADSIVTACPLCHMNLDMRQSQVEKTFGVEFNLPVYYITELVAVACGVSPKEVGIDRHFVEAFYHITHLPQEMEEPPAEPEGKKAQKISEKIAEATQQGQLEKKSTEEPAPESGEKTQPVELNKGAVKLAERLFPDDQEKVEQAARLFSKDPEKMKKVAQMMAQDKEKAVKVAEAFLKKEAKSGAEEVSKE